MTHRLPLSILLVLAACGGDGEDPTDADPTVDDSLGSDTATDPTGDTEPTPTDASTADTASTSLPTGSAVVSTRVDLAPWLGFEVELTNTDEAWLHCDSDVDPEERHARRVGPGTTSLPGVLAGHPFTCRLVADHEGRDGTVPVELWSEQVTTPPLPEGLPELVLTAGAGEVAGGWVVFDQWDQGPTQRALVVDGQARIRWHRAIDASSGGTVAMWSGDAIIAAGGRSLPPTEFDLDGEELFRGPALQIPLIYHHEARWVDVDGTEGILTLSSNNVPEESRTHEPQYGFRAEVHDPATGDLLWTWNVLDHIDTWPPPGRDPDPWHANAVTWGDDGHSWISTRGDSLLSRLDRATGQVTHVLGSGGDVDLFDSAGNPMDADAWFKGQHGPMQVGNRLFVLDNGRAARGATRAVEYELDLANRRVTEVWSWSEPGWFEPYYGNVSLLSGGNVLVASGHCNRCEGSGGSDRKAFVAEIDHATGDVLWRMDMGHHRASLYRAQFVPACDMFHHVGLCTE